MLHAPLLYINCSSYILEEDGLSFNHGDSSEKIFLNYFDPTFLKLFINQGIFINISVLSFLDEHIVPNFNIHCLGILGFLPTQPPWFRFEASGLFFMTRQFFVHECEGKRVGISISFYVFRSPFSKTLSYHLNHCHHFLAVYSASSFLCLKIIFLLAVQIPISFLPLKGTIKESLL